MSITQTHICTYKTARAHIQRSKTIVLLGCLILFCIVYRVLLKWRGSGREHRVRCISSLHWKAFNFGFCWRWRILYSSTSILNCKLGWNWIDRLTELWSSDILQPSWYVLWFITNVFPSYTSASTDRLKTNSRNTHNNVPFPVHLSTKRRLNFLFICTTSYWITFAMVICHMIRVLLWFRLIKNLPSNYTACC